MRCWYSVPAIVRRVHLSWWASFMAAMVMVHDVEKSLALAALSGVFAIPLFFFLDRYADVDVLEPEF